MAAPAGHSLDLATIFRKHAPHLESLGPERARVVRDILRCRTSLLGGHLQVCDYCGREKPFYNSCRNRHCPQCQNLEQARWVEAQQRQLLPVPYFHLVFTVPTALHPFFFADRRGSYACLFEAAIGALHTVCLRRLGAIPGTIAVLHTWTQTLLFHPHLHCIVTGGGFDPLQQSWIPSRPRFLVPVRVLSKVFRGKFLALLQRSLHLNRAGLSESVARHLLRQSLAKEWVVYSKAPMAGPTQVLRYLGRYTHRIAIGNERLLTLQDGRVTFRYRDRRRGNAARTLTLDASDFVRRFLRHVLPHRFVRIRHFGFQANACRAQLIPKARILLGEPASPVPTSPQPESWPALFQRLLGRDPTRCPFCEQGTLRLLSLIPPPPLGRGP